MTDSTNNDDEGKTLQEAYASVAGTFPAGRLNDDDKGATAIEIGVENGRVCLRFPTPTQWLAWEPQEAMEIAAALIKWARRAGSREPLVFRLGPSREA